MCDDKAYVAHANSMFHLGTIFGTLFCGPMSDRYGRRHISGIGILAGAVLALADSFAPTYLSFVILRVGMAFATTLAALAWYTLGGLL